MLGSENKITGSAFFLLVMDHGVSNYWRCSPLHSYSMKIRSLPLIARDRLTLRMSRTNSAVLVNS